MSINEGNCEHRRKGGGGEGGGKGGGGKGKIVYRRKRRLSRVVFSCQSLHQIKGERKRRGERKEGRMFAWW